MKNHILSVGLLAALAVSCSVNEIDYSKPDCQSSEVFYAQFENPGIDSPTKVYATEDLYIRWNADDRITIFNKYTYNQEYRFNGETGDNSGSFKRVDNGDFVTGNSLDNIYAIYPYLESTKISDTGVMTVTLPSEQKYAENTFGLGANTMVSATTDNQLMFKNVGGYLMLKLYGDDVTVTSITLKGNNGEKISGKATITMPVDGVPTVEMTPSAGDEITLVCEIPVKIGLTAESATTFWIAIPPTVFSKGFTLTVRDSQNNEFNKSTTSRFEISRNTLKRMATVKIVQEASYSEPIIIDGDFSDWAKLDATKVAEAKCDPEATKTALKLVKVYADPAYVFVYFEWDKDQIFPNPGLEHVPFHCFINSDGDASTGGAAGVLAIFSDVCADIMLEGFIYPNGTNIGSYEPDIFEWSGEPNVSGWYWSNLGDYKGLTSGAGIEGKYEFQISREIFPKKLADNFSIGFDLEQNWESVGVLPNTHPTDDNPTGVAPFLQVTTNQSSSVNPPTISIPEAVDLGLSVKWASFNLGATRPEEYGDYYAWGETETYYFPGEAQSDYPTWKEGKEEGYWWSSYKWCKGSSTTITKYWATSYSGYEYMDGKTLLDPEDDAAHMNLGGSWRIPTDAEWTELRENCTWEWTSMNGINGRKITGPNGNSIFLPAAGRRIDTTLDYLNNEGLYWSSSLFFDYPDLALTVSFYSNEVIGDHESRRVGLSVRPVCN